MISLYQISSNVNLKVMNRTFSKVDPRNDLIENIMASNGKSRKCVVSSFQKTSWIPEGDEQVTCWIIMTHYYFSHSRHLQVCFSMKVCQNLFFAKIFIKLGYTACPRSKLAKVKGYFLETKLFWPLVGKAKMRFRTIQFSWYLKILFTFSAVSLQSIQITL